MKFNIYMECLECGEIMQPASHDETEYSCPKCDNSVELRVTVNIL